MEAKVSYSEGKGKITYDPNKTAEEEIIKSEIFKGPYSAEIIDDKIIQRDSQKR